MAADVSHSYARSEEHLTESVDAAVLVLVDMTDSQLQHGLVRYEPEEVQHDSWAGWDVEVGDS